MKYAICRISTNLDKQDLSRQIRFAKSHGIEDKNIYKDTCSGSKMGPELTKLLKIVEEGDEVYASDVSRLSRSLKNLIYMINLAKEKKIKLQFGNDFIIDCRNGLSAFLEGQLLMLGLVAELHRLIIVENVNDGLATAREAGRIGGQPKLTKERIYDKNPDFAKYYIEYKEKRINFQEMCRLSLVSRNTGYRYLAILKG